MKLRSAVVLFALMALVVAACGGGDRDSSDGSGSGSSDTSSDADSDTSGDSGAITEFGDLEFPCGPQDGGGELPDDPEQTFGISDAGINIGTFADPGYEAVPGLNQELFDAANTFVDECNAAGGINGRPIELHERDAAILEYSPRVGEACAEDFAVVGGGATLDDSGAQALIDCGIPSIAGFSVTATASQADNVVQPVPNSPTTKPGAWLVQLTDAIENGDVDDVDADAIKNAGILYGDLQTTADVADQFKKTAESLGWEFVYDSSYNIAGEANWAPFAAAIADAGVEVFTYVGSYEFLVQLQEAMDQQGDAPAVIIQEANFYDQDYASGVGALNPDTLKLVRTAYWPFELSDANASTQTYLDLLEKHVPDAVPAQLGMQGFSAWLLFAQAASECDQDNNLTRQCVYDTAKAVTSWTGGGLHAETSPGDSQPPSCGLLLEITGDGSFELWEAEGETPEDAYFCPEENGLIEIEGDYGAGATGFGT